MTISDLETPALLIDLDVMEGNLKKLADYSQKHRLRVRPHTKTHKIPALARKQLDLGAAGLTVAKVGEAEVMLAAQPPDVLVAYPIVGRRKLARLMQVAAKTSITVSLDSVVVAQQLSEAATAAGIEIGVLAEVDVGLGRVGVPPGETLLRLIQDIQRLPGLRFDGIAFYPGQIKSLDEEGEQALKSLAQMLERILGDLRKAGTGNITFLNLVAEKMTGWSQQDAAGRPMAEVLRIMDAETRQIIPNPMEMAVELNRNVNLPSNCVLRSEEHTPELQSLRHLV